MGTRACTETSDRPAAADPGGADDLDRGDVTLVDVVDSPFAVLRLRLHPVLRYGHVGTKLVRASARAHALQAVRLSCDGAQP